MRRHFDRFNYHSRIVIKTQQMTEDIYHRILPHGSRYSVLYGLPKIHKNDAPVRSLISAIGTYNYKLAKYMVEILSPLINSRYILKETFDFVNKISALNLNINKYIISYDVVSLFTNIPTVETASTPMK